MDEAEPAVVCIFDMVSAVDTFPGQFLAGKMVVNDKCSIRVICQNPGYCCRKGRCGHESTCANL